MDIVTQISEELKIRKEQAEAAVKLLDEGNTIPFIARYRKEVTGALDDVQLRDLSDRLTYLRNLEKRKQEVRESIESLGKMTGEIEQSLAEAVTLAAVEDIYRPYKPKKKTRASIAKEKGLEPLAEFILAQSKEDPDTEAEKYINAEKGVETAADAVAGALDIIAENISDDPEIRKILGELYDRKALITSKKADENSEEQSVYENYYDYREAVSKIPTHRILAIDRGEREGVLKAAIEVDTDEMIATINSRYVTGKAGNRNSDLVEDAAADAYKRLIHPSIERRVRADLTDKACTAAIKVFGGNLRQLLMQPPVKGMVTMGFDPGYRTGCKIAVVDRTGKVLDHTVVYPTDPQCRTEESAKKLTALIRKYGITAISIGNGTASHESEVFIADMIRDSGLPVSYMVVSEAGASVYSASKLAQEEFPDFDVTVRSAVSIARRLQDPLSELVKIEPKAIGVGQYQHDMPPAQLSEALGGVVEDCVNNVGVDVNTASVALLSYVAGINSGIAKNIVAYREENGGFTDRKELLKVSKLGKKTFEQCAGFLRVRDGREPLDDTAVHPESYEAARKLLALCELTESDLKGENSKFAAEKINATVKKLGMKKAAEETGVGTLTLTDMIKELMKPGRDPRDELPKPMLRTDVVDINSLKEGMELKGTVRNITDFGAFVDIGVHQDGLVHISQLSNNYVKHPLDVVKVGDVVNVRILGIDVKKNRISLTMKGLN